MLHSYSVNDVAALYFHITNIAYFRSCDEQLSHGDWEDQIGTEVVGHILKQVDEGKFKKNETEEFARNLDSRVYGSFINSQNEVNSTYDRRAMKIILSDWFEKCEVFRLTKKQTVLKLLSALRGADKNKLAYDIENMTQKSKN